MLAFLADAPLASAIYTGLGPGTFVSTSELSLTFIQPVHSGASGLTARARVVHANRQVGVSTAEVEDSQGRLLAYASTRCVINPAAPVPVGEPPRPPDLRTTDPYLRPARGTVYPPELWDGLTGLEFCRQVADGSLDHGPVGYLFGVEMMAASEGSTTCVGQLRCLRQRPGVGPLPPDDGLPAPNSSRSSGAWALIRQGCWPSFGRRSPTPRTICGGRSTPCPSRHLAVRRP